MKASAETLVAAGPAAGASAGEVCLLCGSAALFEVTGIHYRTSGD